MHLETITGHSVCYEERDGIWVNQTQGASRFLLEVRETTGIPGEENYLLTDVEDHTLCVYDGRGLLQYVEYPSHQRLTFAYGEEGLERITTSLGNFLTGMCCIPMRITATDRSPGKWMGKGKKPCIHTMVLAGRFGSRSVFVRKRTKSIIA